MKDELLDGIESENGSVHSIDDAGEEIVVQCVRSVRGKMIMRIAEKGGVRNHQRGKTFFPE